MANPIRWLWDRVRNTFARGKVDGTPGAAVPDGKTLIQRDALIQAQNVYTERAAQKLISGKMTVNQWLTDFRVQLKVNYVQQYMLARGGKNSMTDGDWSSLGEALKKQYEYMNRFAEEIKAGKLSEAQIKQRMQLYFESSGAMYEQGNAKAQGVPHLPQYPGDGATACRVNCKCHWEIKPTEGGWNCSWRLGAAEHCPDCVTLAGRWNPLFVGGAA